MEQYIGTKKINATPMNRQDYNDFRGWKLPENETGNDEGYLVEYTDGGKPNTDTYKGYVSWSPKDVFEQAYHRNSPQLNSNLTFDQILPELKLGSKAARSGWNGKGMWIIYVPGTPSIIPAEGTPYHLAGLIEELEILPHFDMYAVNSEGRRAMLPGWLASQSDLDANDWSLVD